MNSAFEFMHWIRQILKQLQTTIDGWNFATLKGTCVFSTRQHQVKMMGDGTVLLLRRISNFT